MRQLRYLFLQLNRGCNLRCTHCDFWKLSEVPDGLSDPQLLEIIDEFAAVAGPEGRVVSCGGEPMLALDRYFLVAERARTKGLGFLSVTNGSLIKGRAIAERLLREGPTEITISMDGPDAGTHDRLRGASGSFDVTKKAVRQLVETRRTLDVPTKVYVMALVSGALVGKLDAFYELVLGDLGADKLKLNIMQPSFGHGGNAGADLFFTNERIADVPRFLDEVRRTDEKWAIRRNPIWLRQVEMYLHAINAGSRARSGWSAHAQTPEHICNTYERNVMVDTYGNMRLCFSPAFPSRRWSKSGDLAQFWSKEGEGIAGRMRFCNRYCGISHSVRREPATLPVVT